MASRRVAHLEWGDQKAAHNRKQKLPEHTVQGDFPSLQTPKEDLIEANCIESVLVQIALGFLSSATWARNILWPCRLLSF